MRSRPVDRLTRVGSMIQDLERAGEPGDSFSPKARSNPFRKCVTYSLDNERAGGWGRRSNKRRVTDSKPSLTSRTRRKLSATPSPGALRGLTHGIDMRP
jgi:hypothetical protein